jgi:hypothetical protein
MSMLIVYDTNEQQIDKPLRKHALAAGKSEPFAWGQRCCIALKLTNLKQERTD